MFTLALVLFVLDLILAALWRHERTAKQRAQRHAAGAIVDRNTAQDQLDKIETRLKLKAAARVKCDPVAFDRDVQRVVHRLHAAGKTGGAA
jgi:hypothetical protein